MSGVVIDTDFIVILTPFGCIVSKFLVHLFPFKIYIKEAVYETYLKQQNKRRGKYCLIQIGENYDHCNNVVD